MESGDYNNKVSYSKEVLLKWASKHLLSRMYGVHDKNNYILNTFKTVYCMYKELEGYTDLNQDDKINNIILNLKKVDYE